MRGYLQLNKYTHTHMHTQLGFAMNWSRISRRLRHLSFPAMFCPKYSGHCTRGPTFPRWGKRRDQWRVVMSCGQLLALFSAADTAGSKQTTSNSGASTAQKFQAEYKMALTASLRFEEGCNILSYDGANAFYSIYCYRFLPALAKITPSVDLYASNLYAREPLKLLFALKCGGLEVVDSARGVMQSRPSLLQLRLTENYKRVQG